MDKWIPAVVFGCALVGFVLRDLTYSGESAAPLGIVLILGFLLSVLGATIT